MSVFKKLAGQTALYGLSSILGRTINFLLTPLFASYLTVAEFGVSVDIYSIAAVLNIIYLFGFETTYFRFSKKENAVEENIFNQTSSFLLLTSLLFSSALVFIAPLLSNYLEYDGKAHYIYFLAIILFLDTLLAIPFARLRLKNQAAKFAGIKSLNILLNVGFNIFFLAICKPISESNADYGYISKLVELFYSPGDDVQYVFLSNLLANLLIFPFFLKSLLGIKFQWNASVLKSMITYAYPLVILGLAGMTNEMLSRLIFKKILPDNFYLGFSKQEALGIFGACYKLSMFMSLAIQSFRYAAEPFFFNQAQEKNSPKTFAVVMKWFVVSCLLLFLAISLNIELLGQIMLRKEAYQMGLIIVPILLLANMFLGICFNLSICFKLTDNNILGTYISLGGVVITIILNLLLIPIWGFIGSALTTLICYVFMATTSYLTGKRLFPIPYQIARMTFYTTIAIGLVFIQNFIPLDNFLKLGSSFLMILSFVLLVFTIEKKALN